MSSRALRDAPVRRRLPATLLLGVLLVVLPGAAAAQAPLPTAPPVAPSEVPTPPTAEEEAPPSEGPATAEEAPPAEEAPQPEPAPAEGGVEGGITGAGEEGVAPTLSAESPIEGVLADPIPLDAAGDTPRPIEVVPPGPTFGRANAPGLSSLTVPTDADPGVLGAVVAAPEVAAAPQVALPAPQAVRIVAPALAPIAVKAIAAPIVRVAAPSDPADAATAVAAALICLLAAAHIVREVREHDPRTT